MIFKSSLQENIGIYSGVNLSFIILAKLHIEAVLIHICLLLLKKNSSSAAVKLFAISYQKWSIRSGWNYFCMLYQKEAIFTDLHSTEIKYKYIPLCEIFLNSDQRPIKAPVKLFEE